MTDLRAVVRALTAVAVRPSLWPVAARFVPSRWWSRPPFIPIPGADYVRFRMETMYGAEGAPTPGELVAYLQWCRRMKP